MSQFDPHSYGPVLGPLVATDRRRALGFGTPDRAALPALRSLSLRSAFAHAQTEFGPAQPVDTAMGECTLAAVWLVHDFVDESHAISQNIDTPSGSFWHGIMHRREGDFPNAKYWFGRVGQDEVFEFLGQRAGELAAIRGDATAVEKLTPEGVWDAFAFVDMCQAAVRGSTKHADLCLDIQQVEWELLFDYCYRRALGE